MSDGIARPWNRYSGHCLQLGRPDCQGCKWDGCECPSDMCVGKRRSEMAKNQGFGDADRTDVRETMKAAPEPLRTDSDASTETTWMRGGPDRGA